MADNEVEGETKEVFESTLNNQAKSVTISFDDPADQKIFNGLLGISLLAQKPMAEIVKKMIADEIDRITSDALLSF